MKDLFRAFAHRSESIDVAVPLFKESGDSMGVNSSSVRAYKINAKTSFALLFMFIAVLFAVFAVNNINAVAPTKLTGVTINATNVQGELAFTLSADQHDSYAIKIVDKAGNTVKNITNIQKGVTSYKVTNLKPSSYDITVSAVGSKSRDSVVGNVNVVIKAKNTDYSGRFDDIDRLSKGRANAIQWLYQYGITTGGDPKDVSKYLPAKAVNRGSMAQFLHRISGSPVTSKKYLKVSDLKGLSAERQDDIRWLAAEGITVLQIGNRYKPAAVVNRGAMAEFLYKTAGSPEYAMTAADKAQVHDINRVKTNVPRQKAIAWLVKMGISVLDAGDNYNPQNPVNRGSMAEFLRKLYLRIMVPAASQVSANNDSLVPNQSFTYRTHKVTFDANGGTTPDHQIVPVGNKAIPPTTSRQYYAFAGWYTNADGTGSKFDFATPLTKDVTLYAAWNAVNVIFSSEYTYDETTLSELLTLKFNIPIDSIDGAVDGAPYMLTTSDDHKTVSIALTGSETGEINIPAFTFIAINGTKIDSTATILFKVDGEGTREYLSDLGTFQLDFINTEETYFVAVTDYAQDIKWIHFSSDSDILTTLSDIASQNEEIDLFYFTIVDDLDADLITIKGTVDSEANVTIPAGYTVIVENQLAVEGVLDIYGVLIVPADAELTISGTMTLHGSLLVQNDYLAAQADEAGGRLVIESNAEVVVSGTATVEEGSQIETRGTVTIDTDATLTIEGTLRVAAGAEAGKVEVKGTLEVKGSLTVEESSVPGESAGKIELSGKLIIDEEAKDTIEIPDGALEVKEGADIEGGADIKLEINVSNADDLSNAIKASSTADGVGPEVLIRLTEDFYSAVNQGATLLNIGGTPENTTPITIQGLGTESANPKLEVGVAITTPNIILKDTKIEVTDVTKTAKLKWTETDFYRIALEVSSLDADGVTVVAPAITGVVIDNCEVTITNTSSDSADAWTGGVHVTNSPDSFTITDSKVTATGKTTYAVAALMLHAVPKVLTVTGNEFLGKYAQAAPNSARYDAPASAVFFVRIYDDAVIDSINFSNNTYGLGTDTLPEVGTAYSVYINSRTSEEPTMAGVDALRNDYFSTFGSLWATDDATDTDSATKQVLNAHVADVTDDEIGFVFIGEAIKYQTKNMFELEQYRIKDAKVTDISNYGDCINEATDEYDWDTACTNTFCGTPNIGNTSFYGNRTVTDGEADAFDPSGSDRYFYYTYLTKDTDNVPG
ncbi:MAG: S-layer homology domain-containing protein [Bifidobacteriaceae bacterium]|jgi:uncharacterized repeat protein (TIGR02543 family)|nr:S-layer homology domain-containing protein [Bifidobacteriaceae bacterium]